MKESQSGDVSWVGPTALSQAVALLESGSENVKIRGELRDSY